jgi:hypothetical protein
MRDNGLTAASYTSLGPLAPRIADIVLTSLAEAGIAAYVGTPEPTPTEPDPSEPDTTEVSTADTSTADAGETEAGASDEPRTTEASAAEAGAAEADAGDPGAASTADATADKQAADDETGDAAPAGAGAGDELYVDSAAAARAREVVRRRTEDAEWESLIEQFNAPDEPAVGGIPRWPSIEDVEADQPDPSGGGTTSRTPVTDAAGSVVDEMAAEYPGREAKAEAEAEAEEERRERVEARYIPPEPARGPRLDWISRAAWAGVLGGPLLLVLAAILDLGSSSRVTVIALIGFAGGFLTLVARMKDRDTDGTGGPDDGAVV